MKIKANNANSPIWKDVYSHSKLPQQLEPLNEIATNLWWVWNHEGAKLFGKIDKQLWKSTEGNLNPIVQTIILSASAVRMLPHIALYLLHKKEIDADLLKVQDRKPTVLNLIKACTREKSFRNLFYYRMGEYRSVFISWLLPPERTMTIWCPHIGKGAHLEHSYATYLNAESIGDDFYCLQMVTLGNGKGGRPTIGNDVKIYTGATVFGGIHIGNHVTIGAGAVVFQDIPDGATVVGNPGRIIQK